MGFFRDLLHVARMIREERQDGARLFGAAEHLGKQLILGQTEFLEWDQQKLEIPTGLIRCLRGEPPWIVRGFSK